MMVCSFCPASDIQTRPVPYPLPSGRGPLPLYTRFQTMLHGRRGCPNDRAAGRNPPAALIPSRPATIRSIDERIVDQDGVLALGAGRQQRHRRLDQLFPPARPPPAPPPASPVPPARRPAFPGGSSSQRDGRRAGGSGGGGDVGGGERLAGRLKARQLMRSSTRRATPDPWARGLAGVGRRRKGVESGGGVWGGARGGGGVWGGGAA